MRPRKKEHIAIENRLEHWEGEKRERNENIVRDYLNDIPMVDIISKYKISYQMINKIIKKYRWIGAREQK